MIAAQSLSHTLGGGGQGDTNFDANANNPTATGAVINTSDNNHNVAMEIQGNVLETLGKSLPNGSSIYDADYIQFYKYLCDNCTLDYEYFDYDSYQNFMEITETVVIVFFGLVLLSGLIGNGVVVR